jgi:hypothetical protein
VISPFDEAFMTCMRARGVPRQATSPSQALLYLHSRAETNYAVNYRVLSEVRPSIPPAASSMTSYSRMILHVSV